MERYDRMEFKKKSAIPKKKEKEGKEGNKEARKQGRKEKRKPKPKIWAFVNKQSINLVTTTTTKNQTSNQEKLSSC